MNIIINNCYHYNDERKYNKEIKTHNFFYLILFLNRLIEFVSFENLQSKIFGRNF